MKYKKNGIEDILQSAYYNRRTDYVWKYLLGNKKNPEINPYPIPGLEYFVMMDDMLKKRRRTLEEFLKACKTESRPELRDCTYNKRSGILRVYARSFTFTYRAKLNEFHFVVSSKIAKTIGLEERMMTKRYRKDKLFDLYYLAFLDDEIYSRYTEILRVKEWRKSAQFEQDWKYCEAMIPFFMQDAESKKRKLGYTKRLNIILEDDDKVRIGIIEHYTPEEMMAMPSYPRDQWQEGINAAFAALDQSYALELLAHAKTMQAWSDELSDLVLGKTPYSIEEHIGKYRQEHYDANRYTVKVIDDALGIPEKHEDTLKKMNMMFMSKGYSDVDDYCPDKLELTTFRVDFDWQNRIATITLNEEVARTLNYEPVSIVKIPRDRQINTILISSESLTLLHDYEDCLNYQQKMNSPLHHLLVEAVRYIIQQTAPLVAYTGDNALIRDNYGLDIMINDSDDIVVYARFSNWQDSETFTLENYRTMFRVWWSQHLLKECKYAKQCALQPDDNHPFDMPF